MYERTRDNNASINGDVNKCAGAEIHTEADARSNSFLCRVYGIMFLMLLITFVVAYAVGIPFMLIMKNAIESSDSAAYDLYFAVLLGVTVFSSIGLIVTSIIINIRAFTRKHSVIVPGILYAIFMGIMLGTLVGIINEIGSWIIPSVFAIVAMMFGIMYFIAKFVKKIHWLGTIAIATGIGALLLGGVGILLFFIVPQEIFLIFLLIEVLIFIFFIIITIYDIANIQRIADQGCADKNVAFFCALNLYSDFIEIFLKVLWFVLRILAASKKR